MLRASDKTAEALRAGEVIGGFVWPSGQTASVPGMLHWSYEDGAVVDLIEPARAWGYDFDTGEFVAHMRTNENDEITLLNARVRRIALRDEVTQLAAYTLVFGGHVQPRDRWPQATFGTANLTEWRRASGIRSSFPQHDPLHVQLDWEPPDADVVQLDTARLRFSTRMSSAGITTAPDWWISTRQTVTVEPAEPLTIADFHRQYAEPLRAFTTFTSDRPDGLTDETMFDPATGLSVEVWREGPRVTPRPWRLGEDYLFLADDIQDFAATVRAWWTLHEEVYPALGLFAQHISEGNVYSPARLLTLHAALEAYARTRHASTDFKKLRSYAGVPHEVTGCTNAALDLLGYCRGYFAHFGRTSQRFEPRDADEGSFISTRRASALMQACLLRDVGFDSGDTESILRKHYKSWPLRET
jgi:hypothetical protein